MGRLTKDHGSLSSKKMSVMAQESDLDCKVYVDSPMNVDELTRWVGEVLSATHKHDTVYTENASLDIVKNNDFDPACRTDFPDGFLYFPYSVEIYAPRGVSLQK